MSTLTLDIIARDRASKTLKDVGRASDQTSGKLSKGFGGIGKFAGIAAAGVGALGAAGVIMGIKTAASLEQAQIGFTTMLGSAKAAGTYVKDLQKFAANTPFEFQGLVDSSRLLLGVGVASQKVIPMLTDFGDAAGALGIQQDAFQRIMLASSQAISAGRFQVGDLNQIVQNGIPVWSLLSKSLGKPVTELRKMASAGKLTADVVLPALQKQMHKDYGGSMAKQSRTLAGLWSTFTDTLSQGLAQALMPLVPMLKTLLPQAANFLGVALQGLAAGLKFVVTGVQSVIKWFQSGRGSAGELSTAFAGLVGWVRGSLAPALKSFAVSVLPQLKQLFTTVTSAVRDNRATFQALGKVISGVLIPVIRILYSSFLTSLIVQIRVVSWVLSHVVSAVSAVVRAFNGLKKAVSGSKLGAVLAAPFKIALAAIGAAIGAARTLQNLIDPGNGWISGSFTPVSHGPSPTRRRASGGPVTRNTPYLVGEQGPELFVPGQSGGIVPNGKTSRGSAGGGGGNQYITVNLTAPGDDLSQARRLVALLQKLQQSSGKPLQIRTA